MTIKPILFNTEMVRAIIDGRKTQTRRIVKGLDGLSVYRAEPSEDAYETLGEWDFFYGWSDNGAMFDAIETVKAPCSISDILWVRETWMRISDWTCVDPEVGQPDGYLYRAGWEDDTNQAKWRPSIHMPKEAARIFLRVTDVRVERLQDISVEDCKREGIWDDYKTPTQKWHDNLAEMAYPRCFAKLWDSTIKPADRDCYGWEANPWVWVIKFERCEKLEVWRDGKCR